MILKNGEKMNLDDFIEEIESMYQDATERGFDSIVIAIDAGLYNTYYINDTEDGFQCDLFDYVFDDLYDISSQLYDEIQGNVIDIRIEWNRGAYMDEDQKRMACAWCDGEIRHGDKAYKRTGYYGLYCSLECLVKGSRLQYEEVIINDEVINSECDR